MTSPNLVFRIVYNTLYIVLCVILFALLLVAPGDFVRQALTITNQVINVIVLAIVYVVGALIVAFVYATRLYLTRSAIASIPKSWIPIEKGDVNKEVRKIISMNLSRSAAIAWEARPKIMPPDALDSMPRESKEETAADATARGKRSFQFHRLKRAPTAEDEMGIALPPVKPAWGVIDHDGWGSPNLADLPNVQYSTVLQELPNLIEAKAVSLAPVDPDSTANEPVLDAEAVALLQRAPTMTMRDYVTHLIGVGVLSTSQSVTGFLDTYERARFSTRPVSNVQFRKLMNFFADLLRGMHHIDPGAFYYYSGGFDGEVDSESDGHIDDDAPRDTTPTTFARSIASSADIDGGSVRSQRSILNRPSLLNRNSSATANTLNQYRTAPTTPKSKKGGDAASRSDSSSMRSVNTFARTRRPYPVSQPSSSSLGAGSQNSVIRLANDDDDGEMPFVISTPHLS